MTLFKNKYRIESNRLENWDYSQSGIYFLTICVKDKLCVFGEVVDGVMKLNSLGIIVENEIEKSISLRSDWIFHAWVVMPNHIHILVEIVNDTDSSQETHYGASLQRPNENELLNEETVETHRSASHNSANTNIQSSQHPPKDLRLNSISSLVEIVKDTNFPQETHYGASLQRPNENELQNEETVEMHRSASHNSANTNIQSSQLPSKNRRPNSISSFVAQFKSVTTKLINNHQNTDGIKIWQTNYDDHIVRNYKTYQYTFYYILNNPANWNNDSLYT